MIAQVQLWGGTIAAVSLEEGRDVAAFQYDAEFTRGGIELPPLMMPLSERVYAFPALPDKFGNALINAWLASSAGRRKASTRWSASATRSSGRWGRWRSSFAGWPSTWSLGIRTTTLRTSLS